MLIVYIDCVIKVKKNNMWFFNLGIWKPGCDKHDRQPLSAHRLWTRYNQTRPFGRDWGLTASVQPSYTAGPETDELCRTSPSDTGADGMLTAADSHTMSVIECWMYDRAIGSHPPIFMAAVTLFLYCLLYSDLQPHCCKWPSLTRYFSTGFMPVVSTVLVTCLYPPFQRNKKQVLYAVSTCLRRMSTSFHC